MLIEKLQKQTGVQREYLEWVAKTASRRYKIYEIDKREPGETRTIAHPSRQLKLIQRWLCRNYLNKFPVHDCATAYKKGASIRKNAEVHAKTNFTLHLDLKEFFPSFEEDKIKEFLGAHHVSKELGLSQNDIEFASKIVTRHGRLTIGAPSSPMLTNAMLYDFDEQLRFSLERGLVYTRYADDIFISSRSARQLDGLPQAVTDCLVQNSSVKLSLNHKKTARLSRKYRRSITGLVITPNGEVSLGRERKRIIKAMVHKFITGEINAEDIGHLQGLLSFTMDVEPKFVQSLEHKYGKGIISQVLRE